MTILSASCSATPSPIPRAIESTLAQKSGFFKGPNLFQNQQGITTVDFLFAFVLVMGFSSLMFALTITLTVAEVTQYATFTAARNMMPGHISRDDQRRVAEAKLNQFVSQPLIAPFFKSGWFELGLRQTMIGDATTSPGFEAYKGDPASPNKFWGVGLTFTARMLDFQIPFFGATATDSDGKGSGFTTFIASYLGREVTTQECILFMNERWGKIRSLAVSGGASYETNTSTANYLSFEDNGC